MKYWGLLFVLSFQSLVFAQATNTGDEATHQALRDLRDAMVNAVNNSDIDALLSHLHKDVVFTAMNGEVCRGHDALRVYFNKMTKDPGHIVESLHVNPTVDRLTDLYGNTGVSYGSSVDHYKLTTGQEFDIKARWTATLVKENDTWQLASFQSSANVFDNPILSKATSSLFWGAGGAGVIGLLLGLVIGRRMKKSPA
jgi:ketosteroid isomerase-like protein